MPINVNQRVTPIKPAADAADPSPALNDALRQKKKKCCHLDQLEMLVLPLIAQSAPQLDAAIAGAVVSQEQHTDPRPAIETAGKLPLPHRLAAQLTPGNSNSPVQPPQGSRSSPVMSQPLTSGVSPARPQPSLNSAIAPASVIAAEDGVASSVVRHGAVTITPAQQMRSAKGDQGAVTAPESRPDLPRTAEESAVQAGLVAQTALPSSGSPAAVRAEEAWFTAQAAPIAPPKEPMEKAGGMKLSYQFLRWGGGQVDISAQPNQLLFQPSTEMVRDRLGESLLARPQAQSQSWQMDEHPERRQPQPHHNDEEES